jgi:copper resistance protein B
MTTERIRSMATLAAVMVPLSAWAAQHQGHQMGAAQPQPASQATVAECAQAQPLVMRTIDAANMRLEAARQNNSPPAMRAAVDDLQGALRDVRAQLAACAALQTAPADPQAGHATPTTQQPASQPGAAVMQSGSPTPAPAAAAADPHAGHAMSKPSAPAATATKPAAKPESARPAPPAPARDPHAGHGATVPSAQEGKQGKVMDPVNGLMVDPATAPNATYQGQRYYFSSEETRKEFLQNPAKFAKKPKQ